MLRELRVARVDVGIVTPRTADRTAKLVGHHNGRHAAEVIEGADVRPEEVGQRLCLRRFGVGEIARAEDHHEELDIDDLARSAINNVKLHTRVVDEGLLACAMLLAHHERQLLSPGAIQIAELAVLVWTRTLALREHRVAIAPCTGARDHDCESARSVRSQRR